MKNKNLIVIIVILLTFIAGGITSYLVFNNNEVIKKQELSKPEITDGVRGTMFGIDKNINEETIDNYLNRDDSVYRDMRMLIDEGDYESIGGDSYLSGIIKGFEAVPFPLLVNVTGLPDEVGNTYQGTTLFTLTDDGKYIANYEESMEYLEYYFPKDKNIFLMCGGGGYSGMMKSMLIALGWDKDKIYNTGGYWYYKGNNNIAIKNASSGEVSYDFWKVTYHDIDFSILHKVN
jgi:rhodanese-related sulfurtransferase